MVDQVLGLSARKLISAIREETGITIKPSKSEFFIESPKGRMKTDLRQMQELLARTRISRFEAEELKQQEASAQRSARAEEFSHRKERDHLARVLQSARETLNMRRTLTDAQIEVLNANRQELTPDETALLDAHSPATPHPPASPQPEAHSVSPAQEAVHTGPQADILFEEPNPDHSAAGKDAEARRRVLVAEMIGQLDSAHGSFLKSDDSTGSAARMPSGVAWLSDVNKAGLPVSRSEAKSVLMKAQKGEALTDRQREIYDAILPAAENRGVSVDPDSVVWAEKGFEPVADKTLNVNELVEGDRLVIAGEEFAVADIDGEGNVTLKDGVIRKVRDGAVLSNVDFIKQDESATGFNTEEIGARQESVAETGAQTPSVSDSNIKWGRYSVIDKDASDATMNQKEGAQHEGERVGKQSAAGPADRDRGGPGVLPEVREEHGRRVDAERSVISGFAETPYRLREACKAGRGLVHDPSGYNHPEYRQAHSIAAAHGLDVIPVLDDTGSISAYVRERTIFLNMNESGSAGSLAQKTLHEISHYLSKNPLNQNTRRSIDVNSDAFKAYSAAIDKATFSPEELAKGTHLSIPYIVEEYAADLEAGFEERFGVKLAEGLKEGRHVVTLKEMMKSRAEAEEKKSRGPPPGRYSAENQPVIPETKASVNPPLIDHAMRVLGDAKSKPRQKVVEKPSDLPFDAPDDTSPGDFSKPSRLGDVPLKAMAQHLAGMIKGVSVVERDGTILLRTISGKEVQVIAAERIDADKAVLEIGYRQSADGRPIAGIYRADRKTESGRKSIALVRDVAGIWTLSHEFYHFLEDIGAIGNADKRLLNNKIDALIASDPKTYGFLAGRSKPEARAEWVGRTLAGVYDPKTATGRIVKRVGDIVDVILNALGIRTAKSVIRDIESGRIYGRKGSPEGEGLDAQLSTDATLLRSAGELPEKGVVYRTTTNREKMANDQDWQLGKKKGDLAAARRFAARNWEDSRTEKLKELLDNPRNALFIAQPSTSNNNVHPLALAERLAQETGGRYVSGRDYLYPIHATESKKITPSERAFNPRDYKTANIENLQAMAKGKEVVVVDDIFTSEGSAAAFIRALQKEGIPVKAHAGYFGDVRLKPDPQSIDKLQKSLRNANVPVKGKDLAKVLTRSEIGGMIQSINKARFENARQKLTEKLQRLLDRGTAGHVKEDVDNRVPGRRTPRENPGNADAGERISPDSGAEGRGPDEERESRSRLTPSPASDRDKEQYSLAEDLTTEAIEKTGRKIDRAVAAIIGKTNVQRVEDYAKFKEHWKEFWRPFSTVKDGDKILAVRYRAMVFPTCVGMNPGEPGCERMKVRVPHMRGDEPYVSSVIVMFS